LVQVHHELRIRRHCEKNQVLFVPVYRQFQFF